MIFRRKKKKKIGPQNKLSAICIDISNGQKFELWIFWITERRVEFEYAKYGDTPACLSDELNLPDQNLLLQGFGRQATDEKIGELLELELKTISNEECYADLTSQKNHRGFNPGNSTRVRNSLYEGVTDQILCTKLTCNLEENNTELSAKCVS